MVKKDLKSYIINHRLIEWEKKTDSHSKGEVNVSSSVYSVFSLMLLLHHVNDNKSLLKSKSKSIKYKNA